MTGLGQLVRPAVPADVDALLMLADEMDRFYGGDQVEPADVRRRQVRAALFGDVPAAYALIAFDGGQPAGFAAYSFLWPAVGLTRSLYLKELYVASTSRREGIGRRLMDALAEIARRYDCSRVEWTTDRDNAAAQAFYAGLGAVPSDGKLFYRLSQG